MLWMWGIAFRVHTLSLFFCMVCLSTWGHRIVVRSILCVFYGPVAAYGSLSQTGEEAAGSIQGTEWELMDSHACFLVYSCTSRSLACSPGPHSWRQIPPRLRNSALSSRLVDFAFLGQWQTDLGWILPLPPVS